MYYGPGGMRDMDKGVTKMDELDYELWHACAGPLTLLPPVDSLVMYWPQGHIEQVVACTPDSTGVAEVHEASSHFKLPSHLLCKIGNIQLQADPHTDEVFAQMDLTPQDEQGTVTKEMREAPAAIRQKNVQMFCKTLTASDTSTHGGFSVPRRSAEECLPQLDYNMNPPCQELVAKDLHGTEWNFRHIYRGHPRRHLLTTGWSTFVAAKKLVAGDTVIFLRGENGQLRVGVRRATKLQPQARSTHFSSTNLHLGVLASASHAANNYLRFSVIFNPRTSPSEFVIPYHTFLKSQENNLTAGSRFKMKFETEDSSERKYAGTIVEVSDADPKWPESLWRSMKVQWDEISASERHERVSAWEIEPFVPISTLPAPQVGLRPKRRPPTLVKEVAPQGSIQSMLDSFEPNKMARTDQVYDSRNDSSMDDEEDGDGESSRTPSWGFKQEPPPRSGSQGWFSRPDLSYNTMYAGPFQMNPRTPSIAPLAAPLPPDSFERGSGNVRPSLPWPSAQRSDFPSGVNFPFREPPCPNPSLLPEWLRSPKPGGASASSSPRPVFERPIVPSTSLNNEAAAAEMLAAQKLSFELSQWDKVEARKVETTPAPEQQCKLFGFNLAEKAVPALVCPVRSLVSDSEGSGPWPTTDDPSPMSVDQQLNKFGAGTSSTAPMRSGTKVSLHGHVGRTIDLKKIESYAGLRRTLAVLFNLKGQLDDVTKGWQLVYKDHENDELLVGDDPWEEFRSCVRSLKILSPADAAVHSWGKHPASSCEEDDDWQYEVQRNV